MNSDFLDKTNGVTENGDSEEDHEDEETDLQKLRKLIKEEKYDQIIDSCCEILKSSEDENVKNLALLLRGTFYILNKQQNLAMSDLTTLIGQVSH